MSKQSTEVASACYLLGFVAVQCALHRCMLDRVAVSAIQSHVLDRFDPHERIHLTQKRSESNDKVQYARLNESCLISGLDCSRGLTAALQLHDTNQAGSLPQSTTAVRRAPCAVRRGCALCAVRRGCALCAV